NTSSFVGGGGAAGAADSSGARRALFIALITMNKANATIKKLMMNPMNEPMFNVTAPAFFAASSVRYGLGGVPSRSSKKRSEKSMPPMTAPTIGMMTSATNEF